TMLIFLMKGGDPDKWKERAHVTQDGQLILSFPDAGVEGASAEAVGKALAERMRGGGKA
ncbi:unnamed protein product, partial [marine sediment metagenome]